MVFFRSVARYLLVTVVVGGVGLGLLACGNGQSAKEVDVVNPRLVQTPNGERSFAGTLVNQGSRTLSIAQVEVALYDGSGSPVDTVRFDVKDVPSQDSTSFSEKIDSDRAFSQAQVQSILTP